jgi:myo-inositol-1(or 4)-monophosphatase
MSDADARDLLDLAVATAHEAGRLLAAAQQGTVEVSQTKTSPTDVVTEVDVASERLIRDRILAARPDDGFVGEEGDDIASRSGVVWVCDPIDGTVNFIYGIPNFSVSIAARVDEILAAGVVHNPMNAETFTATRGGGAWLGGQRLTGSVCDDVAQALVGTGYAYQAEIRRVQAEETARLLPTVRDVRRMGSAALDLCYVACGRYDAYVERGLHDWDRAAGQLVVEEAGGLVEGLHGEPAGELIVTAASHLLYPAFHQRLLDAGFDRWPVSDWPPRSG